ncbi:MAG TPA: T9SS type A sorting domain-containing protein, partial [Bacteroidia bacterium]|nr:T9SS type A sorting domain-containing protein [Bacteroidia bacterium]
DITASSAWPTVGIITEYDPVLNRNTIVDDLPPSAPQNLNVVWDNNHPRLTWDSNSEGDISVYKIWKYAEGSSMIAATITHNPSNVTHTWMDYDVEPAGKFDPKYTYSYKVKAVDAGLQESPYSNQVSIDGYGGLWKQGQTHEINEITSYALNSNYPNPFNPTTTITYQIPKDGYVNLTIYNSLGEVVKILVNEFQSKSSYSVEFNASNLPSGVYLYRLQTNDFSEVNKMILAK